MSKNLLPLIKIGLGAIALSIASFSIWLAVNRDIDGFAVGEITRVGNNLIEVNDPFDSQTIVHLNENTQITRRRENLNFDDLQSGLFVQVLGKPQEDKSIQARSIRIIKPPQTQ